MHRGPHLKGASASLLRLICSSCLLQERASGQSRQASSVRGQAGWRLGTHLALLAGREARRPLARSPNRAKECTGRVASGLSPLTWLIPPRAHRPDRVMRQVGLTN